jgi:hypothetical protein
MRSIARREAAWVVCALWLLCVPGALAEVSAPADAVDPTSVRPDEPTIDLDQLLKLPDSYMADAERRGGASRSEWRERFFRARENIEARQEELERLQAKMEGIAVDGSSWAAGAPGLSNPDPSTQTLNYKLRQDLRRAREDIEQAERDLRDLRVEADLANVPETWRE